MAHLTHHSTETDATTREGGTDLGTRVLAALDGGSALVGAVAVAKTIIALELLGVAAHPALLGVGFCASVAVYTHNNLTDLTEDATNRPGRTRLVARRRRWFAGVAGLAGVLSVGFATVAGLGGVLATLFPGVVAALYSESWLPVTEFDRLKDVPVVSTALIALAWAVPTTYLPVAYAGVRVDTAALLVGAYLFCRTALASEVMNVRDVRGDRDAGVLTVPVLLGIPRTRWFLYALDLVSAAVLIGGVVTNVLPTSALALCAVIPLSLVLTSKLERGANLDTLAFAKDAEYLVAAGAVVLVTSLG